MPYKREELLLDLHYYIGLLPPTRTEAEETREDWMWDLVFGKDDSTWEENMQDLRRSTRKHVLKEDRAFIAKVMKYSDNERPTAKELLEDEWFKSD